MSVPVGRDAHTSIRHWLVVAAGLALLAPLTLAGAPLVGDPAAAHDVSAEYVTRSGSQLLLAGQPYTFTGVNIYNANSDGWCAGAFTDTEFAQELDEIGLGGEEHGVIRAWFFQTLATAKDTGARDWSRFDRTLQLAAQKGYKVIPTLTDQWGECGTDTTPTYSFKSEQWYTGGYQSPDPGMAAGYPGWLSYRDWVAEIVARYKDDPTILAWQLINEAEVNPGGAFGGCEPGDRPYDILRNWTIDVSGLVRSIDSNHLISLGTIGGGQCGTQIYQYKNLHALPNIDLCEVHDYTPNQAIPGDQWNGMNVRIQQCAELDKPMIVGEVGMWPEHAGGTLAFRAAAVRSKLLAQRALGVDGHIAWAWIGTPSILTSYDIGPGDPVMDELREPGSAFVVTTTDDANDGTCDGSHCSLREAIEASNALPGYDVIGFAIPGPEPHIVSPTTALPAVTDGTLIDATTQPDFRGYPVVELRGDDAPFGDGLLVRASNVAIRGFVIHGFGDSLITLDGWNGANHAFITGNRIGTTFDGTAAAPRGVSPANSGVSLDNSDDNRIGGVAGGDGNTISGNANGLYIHGDSNGNVVLRNFVGTNVFGSGAVPNGNVGIRISSSRLNQIGAPGQGNVISGNYYGMDIIGSGSSDGSNVVQGNYIGVAIDGSTALGNTAKGIEINQSANNLIGGSDPGQGNVISGSSESGITVFMTSGTVIEGNKIGTDASGTLLRPNGYYGIFSVNAPNNRYGGPDPGDGNTIRGGHYGGVTVIGDTSVGIVISGNSIDESGIRPAIDLGGDGVTYPGTQPITIPTSGPNHYMNRPNVDTADPVSGAIEGVTFGLAGSVRVELFASPSCHSTGYGGGRRYLGATDVTAAGTPPFATWSFAAPGQFAPGEVITATATGTFGTSEFSQCVVALGPGPQTYTVTTTDLAFDETCDAAHCSLYDAFWASEIHDGIDTIAFAIPGAGPHVIRPDVGLPFSDPVVIDGTTQAGYFAAPLIVLDGANAADPFGIALSGAGSAVRGLAIGNYTVPDATGAAAIAILADDVSVEATAIGMAPDGVTAMPNTIGILIGGGRHARIGGPAASQFNVISGNGIGISVIGPAFEPEIAGNRIGTDPAGTAAVPNGTGIRFEAVNGGWVGGPQPGAGNLISGNTSAGLELGLDSQAIKVSGNLIGTDLSGLGDLGNAVGIRVATGAAPASTEPNLIGEGGVGNVISGNDTAGVEFVATSRPSTVLMSNVIGLGIDGSTPVPNAIGVVAGPGTTHAWLNDFGDTTGNVIAGNLGAGVVVDPAASGVVIGVNTIRDNGGLGIDLGGDGVTPNDALDADGGANSGQNAPRITAAYDASPLIVIEGEVSTSPDLELFVVLYASDTCDPSGHGEGERLLGSFLVTADGAGLAPFVIAYQAEPIGTWITAAASGIHAGGTDYLDFDVDSSEFSACVPVTLSGEPTPPGSDVQVTLTAGLGVDLTFANVTTGGVTSADASSAPPAAPAGYQLGDPPLYYDITTTAVFSGPIELCFVYDETSFADEASARLLHHDGTMWQDVTSSLDTVANRICGITTSLSPFAVVERSYAFEGFSAPIDPTPTINRVKAGSAVPVKFSLAGGNLGLDIFAAGSPSSSPTTCGSTSFDSLEQTVAAGSSHLTYDPVTDLYAYIWKTDRKWSGCRTLLLTFRDGTTATAWFQFQK